MPLVRLPHANEKFHMCPGDEDGGCRKDAKILTIDTTLIGRIILVGAGAGIGAELLLVLVLLQAEHLLPGLVGIEQLGLVQRLVGCLGQHIVLVLVLVWVVVVAATEVLLCRLGLGRVAQSQSLGGQADQQEAVDRQAKAAKVAATAGRGA